MKEIERRHCSLTLANAFDLKTRKVENDVMSNHNCLYCNSFTVIGKPPFLGCSTCGRRWVAGVANQETKEMWEEFGLLPRPQKKSRKVKDVVL